MLLVHKPHQPSAVWPTCCSSALVEISESRLLHSQMLLKHLLGQHTHSPVMYSNIAPVILHHLDVLHLIKQRSCYIHLNSMLLLTQALLMLYQTCGLYSIPCIIAKLLKTANRDVLMVQYEYIYLSDVLTWTLARRKNGIKKKKTL